MSVGFWGKLADIGKKAWGGIKKAAKKVGEVAKKVGEKVVEYAPKVAEKALEYAPMAGELMAASGIPGVSTVGNVMKVAAPVAQRLFGKQQPQEEYYEEEE